MCINNSNLLIQAVTKFLAKFKAHYIVNEIAVIEIIRWYRPSWPRDEINRFFYTELNYYEIINGMFNCYWESTNQN